MGGSGPIGPSSETTAIERQRRPTAGGSGERCLVVVYGSEIGTRLPLDRELLTVGRDADCEVALSHRSVSRRHARLDMRSATTAVRDLGSTNGTRLNDVPLGPHEDATLRSGDLLQLGGVILKYLDGSNLEALYHEEIYRSILLDGLTGLHTRRALHDFLRREMARARRHRRPLALLLVDADHFKEVNDALGHVAGDHVLRSMARVLEAEAGPDECAARFGGEEFALVLPETDLAGARERAERLRGAVELAPIQVDGERVAVTVSVGAAVFEAPMRTPEDLLRAADAQLYAAKESGRNRVA